MISPEEFRTLPRVFEFGGLDSDWGDSPWLPLPVIFELPRGDDRNSGGVFNLSGKFPETQLQTEPGIAVRRLTGRSRAELYRQWFLMRKNRAGFKGFSVGQICTIYRELRRNSVDIDELKSLIHRDVKLFSQLDALCALESDWFWCISDMNLPWSHALKFSDLPIALLQNLKQHQEADERRGGGKLSSSEFRIHLQLLHDLHKRGMSEKELVALQQEEFRKQGTLHRARNPQLSIRKEKLHRIQQSALKHSGISIDIPENLEGDRIRLSFSVRNGSELDQKLISLKNLTEEMERIERILFE